MSTAKSRLYVEIWHDRLYEITTPEKRIEIVKEVLSKEYQDSLRPDWRSRLRIYGRENDTDFKAVYFHKGRPMATEQHDGCHNFGCCDNETI